MIQLILVPPSEPTTLKISFLVKAADADADPLEFEFAFDDRDLACVDLNFLGPDGVCYDCANLDLDVLMILAQRLMRAAILRLEQVNQQAGLTANAV